MSSIPNSLMLYHFLSVKLLSHPGFTDQDENIAEIINFYDKKPANPLNFSKSETLLNGFPPYYEKSYHIMRFWYNLQSQRDLSKV